MAIARVWRNSVAIAALVASPLTAIVADPYLIDRGAGTFAIGHSQLRNWLADGERGIWMQAGDLRWFYARFAHACHGLSATNSLAFDTRGADTIDSNSAVLVPDGGRCAMRSFAPSEGPPPHRNAEVVLQPQAQ
jgi:hypothetical protein